MACSCGKDTCGCSTTPVVHLVDEMGTPHPFFVTDKIMVETREYALLSGTEDADMVALLRVEKQADGTVRYVNIESEAEWTMLHEVLFQEN
ncbi:DUF1292 domain-containing protein [Alicyclobacillus ferrooxydans]|uniref:DUF1292 domain-containing protein n=1 Tax=Alicyclobacillus ferrooxydans TaxID=471514 RepID=A0A0P9GRR4_9BACL|nr:DUF1292 domain-containing protein [Alicyclobacillus ferrooxydans]KPV43706.1 hypothetical protein AN477_11140 [Alicyclobacillus ferrooxydans]